MAANSKKLIIPRSIHLESSTLCQLKCPTCPTARGETAKSLGLGYLSFKNFKELIDKNPWVGVIELTNWGEMFLNKELIEIMRYADKINVKLMAAEGVNLNTADADVLEALVKYKFRVISCSIDGASQETYSIYRRNGNFNKVVENIKTINHFKELYKSEYPQMKWKFIMFGHNEHEISKARQMARDFNMLFYTKLSYEDLYTVEAFSSVKNVELVRRESGLGVADRAEFRNKCGYEYMLRCNCLGLWGSPNINFDGRVLGCSQNFWGDYGNAFKEGLIESVNNEKINYAREMLMGKEEAREDIPCVRCRSYNKMKENNNWIKEAEVNKYYTKFPLFVFKNAIVCRFLRSTNTV